MRSALRPTTIDDLGKVRQFLRQAFRVSPNAPFLDPSVMTWKYWDRRDDCEGPRAYVLEHDGVIVAHAGIYPLTFDGGEVRGIQMIDWAAANESPGAGVVLLQKLGAMFDFIYSIGGSDMTCKILPAFGFVEYARQWKGARPLRPLRQILQHQNRNWKLAPRLIRNFLWRLPKASERRLDEGWKAEEIVPSGIPAKLFSQSMAEARCSPRPPAFFDYLLRCPVTQFRLHGIQDNRGPRGCFAMGVLRGQARVAGVWLHDPDPEAWQAAFSLAQQTARGLEGACEIVAAGTEGASEQAAARSGLRIMGYTPVYLLNKKRKLALPPDFQFQFADNDEFFLDVGQASYWT
ncbi:MAG: hypothetical protein ABSE42_13105 [Bryobacteraceae bacterium]|jgi:hypothetical protein